MTKKKDRKKDSPLSEREMVPAFEMSALQVSLQKMRPIFGLDS
jgi:hypothetical protein